MNLNDIELPAGLIVSFYKNHLVEGDNRIEKTGAGPATGITAPKDIQFLGQNQKGICLLVDYAKEVYLPDEQLNFLTTILQACKLNLGDVAIINHHRHKISFKELMQKTASTYLLLFGVEAMQLGLDEIPAFNIAERNNYTILVSPAVDILNNNNTESKMLKSKLWNCLKQLFNV